MLFNAGLQYNWIKMETSELAWIVKQFNSQYREGDWFELFK